MKHKRKKVWGKKMSVKGKCETCINFIPHVTVIEKGSEIWGYGCMLGGSYISEKVFFEGCKSFKGKEFNMERICNYCGKITDLHRHMNYIMCAECIMKVKGEVIKL